MRGYRMAVGPHFGGTLTLGFNNPATLNNVLLSLG